MLIAGTVDAAIVIPPDFSQGTTSQGGAIVQVIVDGSNPIIAGQIIGMISRASALAGADLQPTLRQLAPAFELRSRAWCAHTAPYCAKGLAFSTHARFVDPDGADAGPCS